jgi:hypothetical protein
MIPGDDRRVNELTDTEWAKLATESVVERQAIASEIMFASNLRTVENLMMLNLAPLYTTGYMQNVIKVGVEM